MPTESSAKFTLVHGGARDGYQVALALAEANLLEELVTDLVWSPERSWMRYAERVLPTRILAQLEKRSLPSLNPDLIRNVYTAAVRSILLDHAPRLPFHLRQRAIRSADQSLGTTAGRRAKVGRSGLLSYSYYAYNAFHAYGGPGLLFQVHPHPLSIRRILLEELAAHPDCAASLKQEWELSLSEADFEHLTDEPKLAAGILCASTFTRRTLVEHGADDSAIRVVPYGVDLHRFAPAENPSYSEPLGAAHPLRLLFVGRINQRKGIKYLLQALNLIKTGQVEVQVCGRIVGDLDLFRDYRDRVTVRPSVSAVELQAAYQAADLFVLPSVAEGFGQVLLESLASGLPILSTTHTAAPDLITDGVEGFIVEPRRPDLIAEKIEWALTHRKELHQMRSAARAAASRCTWAKFRADIVKAIQTFPSELCGSRSHS